MYDRYDNKASYGGYNDGYGTAVRRSRSIHVGRGGGAVGGPGGPGGMTRRNPYDYLPDEPAGVTGAKPDIMQTSVDQSGGTRLLGGGAGGSGPTGKGPGSSPRYGADNYANEKLSDAYGTSGDYGHRSKAGTVHVPYIIQHFLMFPPHPVFYQQW